MPKKVARRAARRDNTEPGIIRHLTAIGARCWPNDTGYDYLVLYRGKVFLMEIKSPEKVLKDANRLYECLTKNEAECRDELKEIYHIVWDMWQAQYIVMGDMERLDKFYRGFFSKNYVA